MSAISRCAPRDRDFFCCPPEQAAGWARWVGMLKEDGCTEREHKVASPDGVTGQ